MNDLAATAPHQTLQLGTRVAELEIKNVLGVGGFGVVYLAFDHALHRHVALKEFMPASLAARQEEGQICVRSAADGATFALALRSFINEARLLARFDHPALVKVHRFWEANGTAYMVMPYYEGQTLRAALASLGGAPDETWLRALLEPLLGALDFLHREQVYHRDVAPDNILLLPNGAPVLLDFGAARHVITGQTQSLTAILKPNFAPIEQYGESTQMRQGAWTDLYALGAVLYFCITGRPPNPATSRMLDDDLRALTPKQASLRAKDGSAYSAALLGCIDAALSVHPHARPQSVAAFRAALNGESSSARGALTSHPDYPKTIAVGPRQDLRPGTVEPAGGAAVHPSAKPIDQTAAVQTHILPTIPIDRDNGRPARDTSLSHAAGDPAPDAAAALPVQTGFPRTVGWSWMLQYLAVGLLIVGLTTVLASMDLFENAVIVRRRLTASDLVLALGNGAGLVLAWLAARRAAAQLRQEGAIAAQLHRLVIPLAALVILPCAYGTLMPALRPFLSRSLQTMCMWAFVACIVLSAVWLFALLFERAEVLGELARHGVLRAQRALQAGSRSCSMCHTENARMATFCSRCGTALRGVTKAKGSSG